MSRGRRLLAATAALMCVAGAAWFAVGEPSGGPTAASGPSAVPSPNAPAANPAPSSGGAGPARATASPSSPSSPAPVPPASWPPAPEGLRGPVADVLKTAPAKGPVRVTALVRGADGTPHVTVTTAKDRAAAAAAVVAARAVPGVLAVSVDHRVHLADTGTATPVAVAPKASAAVAVSNDPYRSQQWALDTLRAETAWSLHTGAGQTVAVVDTGVDGSHPDLAAQLLPGTDILGTYADGRTDPEGHGTHVAGIIAAVANNGTGVAGLTDGADILPVRVLDASGQGWDSDVANGIIWAADNGASVINLSLAGPSDDSAEDSAVSYAQSKGVLVVAAAGNEAQNGNPVEYPAAIPGVVAVAATDSTNTAASFSEYGPQITLAAPGVDIDSTYPVSMGSYAMASGTSMAAPYVAASAALVRAAVPAASPTDVVTYLTGTADHLGSPGRNDHYGAGLVDPVAALQAALGGAFLAAPGAPGSVTAQPGNASATVSWSVAPANGSTITGYTVTASPGGATALIAPGTAATVTGLSNGVSYTFTVTATNGVGTGPASAASVAVTPEVPRLPLGSFDSAQVGAGGALSLSGWAFDPDTPTAQVAVHVYIDGSILGAFGASASRPDVGAAFPVAGPMHGFVVTGTLSGGTHTVCAYAIDTQLPDQHTTLGCRTVTYTPALPLGWLDSAQVGAGGALSLSGWAFDPDTPTAQVAVHVYIDGSILGAFGASASRPDVGAAFPVAGPMHGFVVTGTLSGGTHTVCAYAIDTQLPALHTTLGCRVVG